MEPHDQNEFRLLIENVRDYAIYMLDPEGRIMTWNLGAERIKGYRRDEVLGQHFSRFFPVEAVAANDPERILRIAREEGRFEADAWRVRKDGTRFWASVVVTALRDESGRLRGFAKITRDMTERKAAEALQEAHVRLYEFLSILAHELRNPIAPIRNAAAIMKQMRLADPALEELRSIIERQTQQLTRLVDDLLDVSRITTGKIRLVQETLDLRDVVRRALEATASECAARGHRIDVSLGENALPVRGDAARLVQVFTNLIDNACKYTPGSGRIVVEAKADASGKRAEIAVTDNGVGIAEAFLPHLFDAFAQDAPARDNATKGLGLGLRIVRELVQRHGGEIAVESPGVGAGSTFRVSLPMAEQTSIASGGGEDDTAARTRARNVLIVDDNRDAGETLATWLRMKGHLVRYAANGADALALLEEEPADVVLLDIGLPDLDGYAVARSIREHEGAARTTLIAVTGYGQYEDRDRAYAAGFDAHMVKPVDFAVLERLLDARMR